MFFGFELCINWANPSKSAKSGFRTISIEPAGSEMAIQQAKAPKRRAFWANLDLPSVPSQMSLSSAQGTGMPPFYSSSSGREKFEDYGIQRDSTGWQIPPSTLEYRGFEASQRGPPIQTASPLQVNWRAPPTLPVSPNTPNRKLRKLVRPKIPSPTPPTYPAILQTTVCPYRRTTNEPGRIHPPYDHGRWGHPRATRILPEAYGLLSCALRWYFMA